MTEMPSLNPLRPIPDLPNIPATQLALYAEALVSCEFPASVAAGDWQQRVAGMCRRRMKETGEELYRRLLAGKDSVAAVNALSFLSSGCGDEKIRRVRREMAEAWKGEDDPLLVRCVADCLAGAAGSNDIRLRKKVSAWLNTRIDSAPGLLFFEMAVAYLRAFPDRQRRKTVILRFAEFLGAADLSLLSADELMRLRSLDSLWYALRIEQGLDTFSRTFHWDIAARFELRAGNLGLLATVSDILFLTEYLEAANHADLLGLPYRLGDSPTSIDLASRTLILH